MMDYKALGIVFSSTEGEVASELTKKRTTASVPFGSRYRLIDFTLSNFTNSRISEVGVIAKNNYRSLMDHVGSGKDWDLARKRGGLTILPPFSTTSNENHMGNIDALLDIIDYINASPADYVVICDCCTVTTINFQNIIERHVESGAEVTVVYTKNDNVKHSKYRVFIDCDENGMLSGVYPDDGTTNKLLANISIVNKSKLIDIVQDCAKKGITSFENELLKTYVGTGKVCCYLHEGVSLEVKGDMSSFIDANMQLLKKDVRDGLLKTENPVYARVRDQVPTRYGLNANVKNSILADGCRIEGTVENSVIFRGVHVGPGAVVKNCVLMQETKVGAGAQLEYIVSDRSVIINDNRRLSGYVTFPIYIEKYRRV